MNQGRYFSSNDRDRSHKHTVHAPEPGAWYRLDSFGDEYAASEESFPSLHWNLENGAYSPSSLSPRSVSPVSLIAITGKTASTSSDSNTVDFTRFNSLAAPSYSRGLASPTRTSSTCSLDLSGLPPDSEVRQGLFKIRNQMAASLERLKQLEKEVQIIPVLQVQISVLQEEKRQLLNQLKASYVLKKSRSCAELCSTESLDGDQLMFQANSKPSSASSTPPKHQSGDILTDEISFRSNRRELQEKRKKIRSISKGKIEDYMIATKPSQGSGVQSMKDEKSPPSAPKDETVPRSRSWSNMRDNSCDPIPVDKRSIGVGNIRSFSKDIGVGDGDIHKGVIDKDVHRGVQMHEISCGTDPHMVRSIGVGIVRSFTRNAACGGDDSEALTESRYVQTFTKTKDNYSQSDRKLQSSLGISAKPVTVSIGVGRDQKTDIICDLCSHRSMKSTAVQVSKSAMISLVDIGVGMCTVDDEPMCEKCLLQQVDVRSVEEISKNLYIFDSRSIGVSESCVSDNFCNRCENIQVKTVGVGSHTIHDVFCHHCENRQTQTVGTDVCFEILPQLTSVGVSDSKLEDTFCDRCENLQSCSVGLGECTLTDRLCNRCDNLKTKEAGVNRCEELNPVCTDRGCSDDKLNNLLCDRCKHLQTQNIACGDCNIDDKVFCDKCRNMEFLTKGVGICEIDDSFCDRCDNLQTKSIGIDVCAEIVPKLVSVGLGDERVDKNMCEKCCNLKTVNVGVGNDNIDEGGIQSKNTRYDSESKKATMRSIGVGDSSISEIIVSNLTPNGLNIPKERETSIARVSPMCFSRETQVFEIVKSIETQSIGVGELTSGPILCDVCGRKASGGAGGVDYGDDFKAANECDESDVIVKDEDQVDRQSLIKSQTSKIGYSVERLDEVQVDCQVSRSQSMLELSTQNDDTENEEDIRLDDEFVQALKLLNGHFLRNEELAHDDMISCMSLIENNWFNCVGHEKMSKLVISKHITLISVMVPMLLDTIINLADENGNTAIHFALSHRNFSVVELLIDSKVCNINIPNKAGYTPLMLTSLIGTRNSSERNVVRKMFKYGDVNLAAADTSQTPLMLAASQFHLDMVELLLEAGADVNATDEDDSTALMCACEHGHAAVVKRLLSHPDCDASIYDRDGSTAMSIAMDKDFKSVALLIYAHINFRKSKVKSRLTRTKSAS